MSLIDKRFSATETNEKSTPLPLIPKEILRKIYAFPRAEEGILLPKWQILCANEGIFLTKCPHLHFVKTYIYKKLNLLTFKITGS